MPGQAGVAAAEGGAGAGEGVAGEQQLHQPSPGQARLPSPGLQLCPDEVRSHNGTLALPLWYISK